MKLNVNELSNKNKFLLQLLFFADTQPGILLRLPKSAICVQVLDDSQNSAIHMSYHILLCSSSSWEPRYPMLKVVIDYNNLLSKSPNKLMFRCLKYIIILSNLFINFCLQRGKIKRLLHFTMFRPKANAFRHLLWFECFFKLWPFIISNQVSKSKF